MITSKKELKEYIHADLKASGWINKSLFREWLKGNREEVALMKYCLRLRQYEYACYMKEVGGGIF